MLKIYFVEDDAAIRESIIRNTKWEQYGYEFVGQASDGEMAYSELLSLRPDVLITDLKMPFMDGLELSRLVRREMPDTKIIVLTGYNDFESVQEALHIGVTRYLLKPVTPENLAEAIVEMRDLIFKEWEQAGHRKEYLDVMDEMRGLIGNTDVLKELVKSATQLRNSAVNARHDSTIERAKDFIRENYNSDEITLNKVAKTVNLSPTHFSTIFSKEAGKTFTEFLTEVRMEKAKELLLCSSKRSSEIAYEVGYHDPHYFSYVFKRIVGCSPREFRISGRELL